MQPPDTTLSAVIREAETTLAEAEVQSPRNDAEMLAAHVLGLTRAQLAASLITGSGPRLDPAGAAELDALVARRAKREPLQYITGEAPFRHLVLAVGPGVLVPRPETEGLVDLVLAAVRPGCVVVDLFSGSGAVALAVAQEAPGARVLAVERDADALGWLDRNVELTGLVVEVVAGDVVTALPELDATVDAVLANPPYLPEVSDRQLAPELLDHEPPVAFWGGPDGLQGPQVAADAAARLLRSGGLFAMEHDSDHGDGVMALLERSGCWEQVTAHTDLAGYPRYATAVRSKRPATAR